MTPEDAFTLQQLILVFGVLAALLVLILHRLKFDRLSIDCYLLALACTFLQFALTTPFQYAGDNLGHIGYLDYITTYFELPPPTGWQTQQPPLFYLTAALLSIAGTKLGLAGLYCARVAPVLFYFGAMIFSGLLLRRFIRPGQMYYLCLLAIFLWPAGPHTSVKISNDIGQFFFACGFVYFITRWVQDRNIRWLAWCIVFAGGGIASKSTALLLLFVLACAIFVALLRKRIAIGDLCKPVILFSTIVLVACVAINFGRIYEWKIHHNDDVRWLINRDENYVGSFEHVNNTPKNYLHFKYKNFLNYPFMRFENTAPEAHYFFNVLFKTLMFGDFGYMGKGSDIAIGLNFLFLSCLACFLALLIGARKYIVANPACMSLLFISLSSILMVMAARIMVPVSFQASGRYIYVIVIMCTTLYGHLTQRLDDSGQSRVLAKTSTLLLFLFIQFSMFFFAAQWPYPFYLPGLATQP